MISPLLQERWQSGDFGCSVSRKGISFRKEGGHAGNNSGDAFGRCFSVCIGTGKYQPLFHERIEKGSAAFFIAQAGVFLRKAFQDHQYYIHFLFRPTSNRVLCRFVYRSFFRFGKVVDRCNFLLSETRTDAENRVQQQCCISRLYIFACCAVVDG